MQVTNCLSYSLIGIREMTSVIVLGPISPLTSSYFIFLNIGAWGDVLFAKKILSCKKNEKRKKKSYNTVVTMLTWLNSGPARALLGGTHWSTGAGGGGESWMGRYLRGRGCPSPVSSVDCHQVVVLGKGIVVLQHCDLHLDRRMALGGPCSVGSCTTQQPRVSWAFMTREETKIMYVIYSFHWVRTSKIKNF